jgi:hypothetical protein
MKRNDYKKEINRNPNFLLFILPAPRIGFSGYPIPENTGLEKYSFQSQNFLGIF